MSRINDLYRKTEQRSLTGLVHGVLLPLKLFFLLVLLAISMLLAARHASVEQHYETLGPRIELGVLVGTVAMIFFPLMSQAFVLTTDALYGTHQIGGFKPMVPFMSFCFGAWGLLILFFFYKSREQQQLEVVGKLAGVLASAIAVLKYDLLISVINRLVGAGASIWMIITLAAASVAGIVILLLPVWRQFRQGVSLPSSDEAPV